MAAGQQEHTSTTTSERTPGTAAPAGSRPGRALAALILGIVSIPAALIPILGLLLGIAATVLGITARKDIRRNGLGGHGQATAGMVLGIVGIVLAVALMIVNAVIIAS